MHERGSALPGSVRWGRVGLGGAGIFRGMGVVQEIPELGVGHGRASGWDKGVAEALQPDLTKSPGGDPLIWGIREGSWLCPRLWDRGAARGPGSLPVGPTWALINSRNCSQSKTSSLSRSFFFFPSDAVPPHRALPCGLIPRSHPVPSRWGTSGGISLRSHAAN